VLGPLRHASGRGLATSYGELIARAFQPRYHASAQRTPEGLTQLEANFALFWGVALQLYQATLVSDDTPFDRFMEGDGAALTDTQKEGLLIFVTHGRCNRCHTGAEFTSATVGALVGEQKVVTAMELAQGTGLYDFGFYNLGVRPPGEDVGLGGSNPWGQPLSYARQLLQGAEQLDVCALGGAGCPGPEHLSDGGTPLTGSERVAVTGAFKTPGLRNVELTGPYMHNGGMATLLEVMEFYHRGGDFPEENRDWLGPHMGNINLESGYERQVLADFLTSLTDERVRHQRAPFDHPELTLPDGVRVEAVGRQGGAPLLPFHQRLQ
jgi:hypothetical protein